VSPQGKWPEPDRRGDNLELPKKVVRHYGQITRPDRNLLNQQTRGVLWFTGLSDAAESTIAHDIEPELFNRGIWSYVLNGDNVRHGLNSDLGFSPQDRKKNIRIIVEATNLSVDAGFIFLI
jgi:adenylylsulfate kinase